MKNYNQQSPTWKLCSHTISGSPSHESYFMLFLVCWATNTPNLYPSNPNKWCYSCGAYNLWMSNLDVENLWKLHTETEVLNLVNQFLLKFWCFPECCSRCNELASQCEQLSAALRQAQEKHAERDREADDRDQQIKQLIQLLRSKVCAQSEFVKGWYLHEEQ